MTAQATFCATLVDEWVRAGVRHAVLSPGSRSTPLALALARRAEISVDVVLDERSAAFVALGIGAATGTPAVLACTSGTAAANFHPAIVEADLAAVPMIVCTADRPPELRDVGAPQAIDQNLLYGRSVRWFQDPGVADTAMAGAWRSIASRAYLEAREGRGPVHLNLPFRDPLLGEPDLLPEGRSDDRPWHTRTYGATGSLGLELGGRGIIVAGLGADPWLAHLATTMRWPLLADPLSGLRGPTAIATADALSRCDEWASAHRPEVVLHSGRPWASKALGSWLERSGARHVLLDPNRRWSDPGRLASEVVPYLPTGGEAAPQEWLAAWTDADAVVQSSIDRVLDGYDALTEPGIARRVTQMVPAGTSVVVASSMPVRDLEWYGVPREDVFFYGNRGANGIDGVPSTAVGVATANAPEPTVCLLGDLAFLHDLSGLVAAAGRNLPLTFVVVDNNGGGIFEFLPQASELDRGQFETLFGTPHGLDLAAVAGGLGLETAVVSSLDELEATRARVVIARTDRATSVKVHDEIHSAVADALTA